MKKNIFFKYLILTIALLVCINHAQAQAIRFEIIYGSPSYDEAKSIWQTTDRGYIIAGKSGGIYSGNSDVFLLKTDSVGAIKWFRFYGGVELQNGTCVQQTSDGGFIVSGFSTSGMAGYDFYLMKTDANGDQLWEKTFGGQDWDLAAYVEETTDGGFIITGSTYSFGKAQQIYMVKTDASGNLMWEKAIGGAGDEFANCVRKTVDGGYILAGASSSYGNGTKDYYLHKTNAQGDSLWAKVYTGAKDDVCMYVDPTSDGGYIMCGYKTDSATGRHFHNYIKTDMFGNIQWQQIFSAAVGDDAYVIRQYMDGGYVAAGSSDGAGAGKKDFMLVRLDQIGLPVYSIKSYGGIEDDIAYSMQITHDNGFVLVGETKSYGTGLKQIYVLKTDSLGVSSGTVIIGIGDLIAKSDNRIFQIYPNPSSDKLKGVIALPGTNSNAAVTLTVRDIAGKELLHQAMNVSPAEELGFELDLEFLDAGVYFVSLLSENSTITRKLIHQK